VEPRKKTGGYGEETKGIALRLFVSVWGEDEMIESQRSIALGIYRRKGGSQEPCVYKLLGEDLFTLSEGKKQPQ
jgi:hypothetical protein